MCPMDHKVLNNRDDSSVLVDLERRDPGWFLLRMG